MRYGEPDTRGCLDLGLPALSRASPASYNLINSKGPFPSITTVAAHFHVAVGKHKAHKTNYSTTRSPNLYWFLSPLFGVVLFFSLVVSLIVFLLATLPMCGDPYLQMSGSIWIINPVVVNPYPPSPTFWRYQCSAFGKHKFRCFSRPNTVLHHQQDFLVPLVTSVRWNSLQHALPSLLGLFHVCMGGHVSLVLKSKWCDISHSSFNTDRLFWPSVTLSKSCVALTSVWALTSWRVLWFRVQLRI